MKILSNVKFLRIISGILFAFVVMFAIGNPNTGSEVTKLKEQNGRIALENENFKNRIQDYESRTAEVKSKVSEQQKNLDDIINLNKKLEGIQLKKQQLQRQYDKVSNAHKKCNTKISDLKRKNKTLKFENKYLRSQQSNNGGGFGNNNNSKSDNEHSETVYITRTGSKYHRGGCRYLKQSQIAIELSNAEAQGYSACSVCF